MINYYEELGISKESSLKEISEELAKQENLWRHREVNQPEKSTKMLSLIFEAREVFSSNDSRNHYDRALAEEDSQNELASLVSADFDKWLDKAKQFYDAKEYDMAKTAVDKALLYMPENMEDSQVFWLIASIYRDSHELKEALKYINQAILYCQGVLGCYGTKIDILTRIIDGLYVQNASADQIIPYTRNIRDSYRSYIDIATKEQGKDSMAAVLGISGLAVSYYHDAPRDEDAAEQYARQAIELNEQYAADAQKVMNSLYGARNVDVSEFAVYRQEKSPYEEAINERIQKMKELKLVPPCIDGWELNSELKSSRRWINREETYAREEYFENITAHFMLSDDGTFRHINNIKTETDRFIHDGGFNHDEKEDVESKTISMEDMMMEFDFQFSQYWTYQIANDEVTIDRNIVSDISYTSNQLEGRVNLIRKFPRRKGYGLFLQLKRIVDNAERYYEECKKANEEYEAEIEPEREQIRKKYEEKCLGLYEEMQIKIEAASENEKIIQELKDKISDLETELSKLGLFSKQRKKELKNQINAAWRKIDDIQTVKQIQDYYDRQKASLNHDEEREISLKEQSVRAKHPLPDK